MSQTLDVAALAAAYADKSPQEVLKLAFEHFGDDLWISFSGAEDVVLVDMAWKLNKSVRVYRRTGSEFLAGEQRPLRYRQENLVEWIQIPTAEPLQLELQDFVRCVRQQATPKVSAAEALRALTVAAEVSEAITAPASLPADRRRDRRPKKEDTQPSRLAAVSGGLR